MRTSSGSSRNTGPGVPDCAMRNAASTYPSMRRVSATRTALFVIERIKPTASMSCSEPMSASASGPAPPRQIIGTPARCALATAVTTSVTPGPAVTAQTPGRSPTREYVRGDARRLLVSHIDDADPFVETAVVDRLDAPAAEREKVLDPVAPGARATRRPP